MNFEDGSPSVVILERLSYNGPRICHKTRDSLSLLSRERIIHCSPQRLTHVKLPLRRRWPFLLRCLAQHGKWRRTRIAGLSHLGRQGPSDARGEEASLANAAPGKPAHGTARRVSSAVGAGGQMADFALAAVSPAGRRMSVYVCAPATNRKGMVRTWERF
jgi:hypothetical protein